MSKLPSESLGNYLEQLVHAADVHAVSVALSVDGAQQVVSAWNEEGAAGNTMGPDSAFACGCLVKMLTAMVGVELASEGALDLDAPIATYLHELEGDDKGNSIAVRHLMRHSSGYAGIRCLDPSNLRFGWEDLLAFLRSTPQLFEPGSVFSYDLSAAVLFARIVERVTGQSVGTQIGERILRRLNLRKENGAGDADSIAARFASDMNRASTGIWSTSVSRCTLGIAEALAVAEVLLTSITRTVNCDGRSGSAFAAMTLPEVPVPELLGGLQSNCMPVGWGLGLAQFQYGVLGHDGMGVRESFGVRISRSQGIAMAVGVRADNALTRQRSVVDALLSEMDLGAPAARESLPVGIEPDLLSGDYIGSQHCTAHVTTRRNEVDIEVRLGGSSGIRFKGTVDSDGVFSVWRNRSSVGVAFFKHSRSESPCLMFGDQALRNTRF